MAAEPRTWLQKNKRPLIIAAVVVVTIIVLLVCALAVYRYGWDWTGFNGGYHKITTTETGASQEQQPAKTLWDWMQLLLIPILLAIGGFWLNKIQKDRDQTAEQAQKDRDATAASKREDLERKSREDNQREAALQEYITKMSELLLEKNLHGSAQNEEVRKIARVQTLTTLGRLDDDCLRKRSVLLFLQEAGLVASYSGPEGTLEPIIDLWDADFSQADLSRAHLNRVSLSKANLSGADLRCTFLNKAKFHWAVLKGAKLSYDNCSKDYRDEKPNLREADFSKAYLNDAKLINVDLSGADLSEADLSGADLSEAILFGADLSGANLSGVDLRGANLEEAHLVKTILKGARYNTKEILLKDSRGENLVEIPPTTWPQGFNLKATEATEENTLFGVNLSRFSLSNANLDGADLHNTNLSGADLHNANLSGADLHNTNLSGADLHNANLSGAKVTEEQLKKAKSLQGATMPDGSIHP